MQRNNDTGITEENSYAGTEIMARCKHYTR
jgi:hypothetical protein